LGLKFELKWLGIGVGSFLGIIGLVLVTGYEPPPPEKQNKINYDNLSEEELQSMGKRLRNHQRTAMARTIPSARLRANIFIELSI